jgi:hypothetical protein
LRGVLDTQLALGLREVEEDQLINGSGTPPDRSGILDRSGLATPVARSTDSEQDAILKEHNAIAAATNMVPDLVVLNPADLSTIQFAKSTAGIYYFGGPGVPPGGQSMWHAVGDEREARCGDGDRDGVTGGPDLPPPRHLDRGQQQSFRLLHEEPHRHPGGGASGTRGVSACGDRCRQRVVVVVKRASAWPDSRQSLAGVGAHLVPGRLRYRDTRRPGITLTLVGVLDNLDGEGLAREARECEQLHVSLLRRCDELAAGIALRRAHRERLLEEAEAPELAWDADRIALGVGELRRMDELDQEGVAALAERAAWVAELGVDLRERSRRARG